MIRKYQFTQSMWSEEPGMTKILFDTQIDSKNAMICNITNPNRVKKAFINNIIFYDYVHFRDVVQPFPLDLQDNMRLFQPLT